MCEEVLLCCLSGIAQTSVYHICYVVYNSMYVLVLDRKKNKKNFMNHFKKTFKPFECTDAAALSLADLDKRNTYIIYGILRGCGDVLKACMRDNIHYIYIDNSYFPNRRKVNYSITWDGMQNTKYHEQLKFKDFTRSYKIIAELSHIRKCRLGSTPSFFLICPPSKPIGDLLNAHSWTEDVVKQIRKSSNQDIVIRPKGGFIKFDYKRMLSAYGNIRLSQHDLLHDLGAAVCACVYNSRVAIEAVIAGVPVFTSPCSIAYPISQKMETVANPTQYDADHVKNWLEFVARSEFSPIEIQRGCNPLASAGDI